MENGGGQSLIREQSGVDFGQFREQSGVDFGHFREQSGVDFGKFHEQSEVDYGQSGVDFGRFREQSGMDFGKFREQSGADYGQFSRQRRPGGEDIDEIVQIVRQQEDKAQDMDAELSLKKFAPLPGIRRQEGGKGDPKDDLDDPVAAEPREFFENEDVLLSSTTNMSPTECDSPLPSPRSLLGHASDNNLYGKMDKLSLRRDGRHPAGAVEFDADLLAVSTGFESALSRQRRRTRSDPCRKPHFKGMRLPPIAIIHMPDRPAAPEPTHTPPAEDYGYGCDSDDEEPIDHIDPGQ